MADTISRAEAVDSEAPQLHSRLEKLTGKEVLVILIAVDDTGMSILGNTPNSEDMALLLVSALERVITRDPDHVWNPSSVKKD